MSDESGLLTRWKLVLTASRDRQLTRADWGVLMAIVDRIDVTGHAWPGLSCIASDAGVDRTSAVRSVGRLVSEGYLVRESGGRNKPNRYRLGRRTAAPSGVDAPSGTAASGIDALGVGAALHLRVGAPVHPEPTQLNLPNEPTCPSVPAEDRFGEFWSAYPRKEGRAKAAKAWTVAKLDPLADSIVADVIARISDPGTWTDHRFIPHPTTYLNQRRWEDEWNRTRASRTSASTSDQFSSVAYTGTPLHDLPESLRPVHD